MKGSFYIPLLILLTLFASCRKTPYPASRELNSPVFYFKGEVNGQEVLLEAGRNNYYMRTFQAEREQVQLFAGELVPEDCPGSLSCEGLSLQLFDYGTTGQTQLAQSFRAGDRKFFLDTDKPGALYRLEAYPNNGGTPSEFQWRGEQGTVVQGANHEALLSGNAWSEICVASKNPGGCQSTNCLRLKPGPHRSYTNITATATGNRTFRFSFGGHNPGPLSTEWSFGDGSRSSSAEPVHTFPHEGSYPVQLRVSGPNTDTTYTTFHLVTQNDRSSCAVNYRVLSLESVPVHYFSRSVITWVAGQTIYSSAKVAQPSDAFFEIVSSEDFEKNEEGYPTKKVRVRFTCALSDGNSVIQIRNAEAVLALACPR